MPATTTERWRTPRPDPEVIELIDAVRAAALRGEVRAIAIVTLDPMLHREICMAGMTDEIRKGLLAAGCMEVAHKVLRKPVPE